MARTGHTSAPRGARIRIVFRDGAVREARFVERTGQYIVVLLDGEKKRLRGREISSLTICR